MSIQHICIPEGKLAQSQDDAAAARKRRELRDKLMRGEKVVATPAGQVKDEAEKKPDETAITIPEGKLAQSQEEDAAARKRRELRDKLMRGEKVVATPAGQIKDEVDKKPGETAITIPEGKLAAGYYWYERDPALFEGERTAMAKYFPQFKLEKLEDGRLSWVGMVTPTDMRPGAQWIIQVVYDHNHPSNSTYGGSIKIYSIDPDLAEISKKLGESIPCTLRDSAGNPYLCTASPGDIRVGNVNTSAASALSWAIKWIHVFEMWLAGDVSTAQFRDHIF